MGRLSKSISAAASDSGICFPAERFDPSICSCFKLLEVSVHFRPKYLVLCFAAAFTLLFGINSTANAQRYLGGIQGQVTDSTGANIQGAAVVAEETLTHFKTAGTTN